MAAQAREALTEEYTQYGPTALGNLEKILLSDITNCEESIQDAPTDEWAAYWLGAKEDYTLELSVCQARLAQLATAN
jgi:hypothetical protein